MSGLLFFCVVVLGTAARLWLASSGFNYDIHCFWNAITQGEPNFWTDSTSYGPLGWAWYHLPAWLGPAAPGSILSYHRELAIFATVADLGTAAMLWRAYGLAAGAIFFLCPITLIITGFHTQFDPPATCLAVAGWLMFTRRESPATAVLAGLLFGLSLGIKHIFVLVPMLLFVFQRRPLWHWVICCALAYSIWLGGLWLAGSAHVVLAYRGHNWWGNGLMPHYLPEQFWMAGLLVAASVIPLVFAVRGHLEMLLPAYTVALLAFSPTIGQEYTFGPVLALALWPRNPFLWAFAAVVTYCLCASANEMHWFRSSWEIVPRELGTTPQTPQALLIAALVFMLITLRTKEIQYAA